MFILSLFFYSSNLNLIKKIFNNLKYEVYYNKELLKLFNKKNYKNFLHLTVSKINNNNTLKYF